MFKSLLGVAVSSLAFCSGAGELEQSINMSKQLSDPLFRSLVQYEVKAACPEYQLADGVMSVVIDASCKENINLLRISLDQTDFQRRYLPVVREFMEIHSIPVFTPKSW